MQNPTQCVLWENPDLVAGPQEAHFERIDTYVDDSHLMRQLLRCRECGQLYFFEFYEEVDWEEGNDPQYTTYIAVESDTEIDILKKASSFELLKPLSPSAAGFSERRTSADGAMGREMSVYIEATVILLGCQM